MSKGQESHEITYYECPRCKVWRADEAALLIHYRFAHGEELADPQKYKNEHVVYRHKRKKGKKDVGDG